MFSILIVAWILTWFNIDNLLKEFKKIKTINLQKRKIINEC